MDDLGPGWLVWCNLSGQGLTQAGALKFEQFSSQAALDVLLAFRRNAESQGRQLQAVLDDALCDYIDRQQKERPRRHAMAAFATSLDEFAHLDPWLRGFAVQAT